MEEKNDSWHLKITQACEEKDLFLYKGIIFKSIINFICYMLFLLMFSCVKYVVSNLFLFTKDTGAIGWISNDVIRSLQQYIDVE